MNDIFKMCKEWKRYNIIWNRRYQSLILPLVKSLQYFDEAEAPLKTHVWFDAHLAFAVGVIDGPMVGVTVDEKDHKSELLPWVRVFRHESYEDEHPFDRHKVFAIDIVHKDFFELFIEKHLLPFVSKFSEKILKHDTKLAEGKAFIKKMGKDPNSNLEKRLEKYSIIKSKIFP